MYPIVAVETYLFAKPLLSNGCLCWLHSSYLNQIFNILLPLLGIEPHFFGLRECSLVTILPELSRLLTLSKAEPKKETFVFLQVSYWEEGLETDEVYIK
jgi:hypothetical protein